MKRREAQSNATGVPDQCKLSSGFPSLWEFMTEAQWDDGKPREPGTFTVFVQEGRWKAVLNDKDADASTFVSARTFTDLLALMNDAINDPTIEWRDKDKPNKQRR